jgi:hypothetical protein
MVNALIKLDENTNRILNLVKAKYNLKDKGEAVNVVVSKFIEMQNEPELRPEFIEMMGKIERQRSVVVEDFAKRYHIN